MSQKVRSFAVLLFLPLILLNLNCAVASSLEDSLKAAAPDFTLGGLNGEEVTLSQFKNKKNVLLVFGATWCPSCRKEIPELKRVYEKFNDEDIKLLSIDVQESHKKVSSFVKAHSIPYTVLLDTTGEVTAKYGVRGIPHITIIDKDGSIFYDGHTPPGGLMSFLSKLSKE